MCASALCLPVCVFNHPFVFFFSFSYFFFSFALYYFPCILPPVGYIRFRFILCERREATYILPIRSFCVYLWRFYRWRSMVSCCQRGCRDLVPYHCGTPSCRGSRKRPPLHARRMSGEAPDSCALLMQLSLRAPPVNFSYYRSTVDCLSSTESIT